MVGRFCFPEALTSVVCGRFCQGSWGLKTMVGSEGLALLGFPVIRKKHRYGMLQIVHDLIEALYLSSYVASTR